MFDYTHLHGQVQLQQLQKNLEQSERELARARSTAESARQTIIRLGQRFTPEAFAALTNEGAHQVLEQLKTLPTEAIVELIVRAFDAKVSRLTAFTRGLTAEQQAQVMDRILGTHPLDWLEDPKFAQAQQELAAMRQALRLAQIAEQQATERASTMHITLQNANHEVQQARQESIRLREEMAGLQARLLQYQSLTSSAQSKPIADVALSKGVNELSDPFTPMDAKPVSQVSSHLGSTGNEVSTPSGLSNVDALIFVLATRGLCERSRLSEILHREFGIGDSPAHFLVTDAFMLASQNQAGWIHFEKQVNETGVGSAPHLCRLTEAGQHYVREKFHIEPVPSELDQLLKLHDGVAHVTLILQARSLFLDGRFPEVVARVDLFPLPIPLGAGKRCEPDLGVTLKEGQTLLIECERETIKNSIHRADKWAKYYQATGGDFYIICPNTRAVSALASEIGQWQLSHGGPLQLHITSVYQVRSDPTREFWTQRDIGK
ncbi:MAG: hypothetical protein HZB51_00945 [Chloroflexi bacterium]|nr:hypothetical protein [Chloroflexota bacterium]